MRPDAPNILANALRAVARRRAAALDAGDLTTIGLGAVEIERQAGQIKLARELIVTTIESDSVAAVSAATEQLVSWALEEP